MESAALVYLDLLEGKNKAVAGTTCEFKHYLSCTFFTHLHRYSIYYNWYPQLYLPFAELL